MKCNNKNNPQLILKTIQTKISLLQFKMPNLILNSKYIGNMCNYKYLIILSILLVYFLWMDIQLFINVQKWVPKYDDLKLSQSSFYKSDSITISDSKHNLNNELNDIRKKQKELHKQFVDTGPFSQISVKIIMIDHMTHYVYDIIARFIENDLYLTYYLPWLSPNMVSIFGLFCAIVASRLILSDKLSYRRIGCILFELRNFSDSLDGVVFRALANKNHSYESVRGTLGYNVDVICDGLGGLVLVLALFIRFLRNPPTRSKFEIIIIKIET